MIERKFYYICGSIMFLIFVISIIIMLGKKTFSYSFLTLAGLSYMFFAIGYLQPHVANNDERAKFIKQKTMKHSLFIIMLLLFIITFLTQTNIIHLQLSDFLSVFVFLSIGIIFTLWMIVAIRN